MEPPGKVPVIGVGPDGLAGLTARSRELLVAAELVFGSDSVLRLLPELTGERVRIGADLPEVVGRLRANLGRRRMAIVATGDPLFYGTARYLCEKVGAEHFDVLPHVSSMQLAFARIKESWEDAYLTDLSAKSLDDVLDKVRTAETVGLFTSEAYHPARVARELLARGIDYFTAFVCENLGGKDERITRGEMSDLPDREFGVTNVKPVFGTAPAVFAGLPAPDAIFVGGNGGEVAKLLEACYAALRPGGRLVTNVGTLDMLTATYAVMKRLASGVEVLLMNVSRGVEQLEALRFEAVNPTFLLRVQRPAPD